MSARIRKIVVAMVAALVTTNACARDKTTDIMHEVYDAIAYLLPLSVRRSDTSSPWDGELTRAKLASLQRAGEALVAHTSSGEAELRLLARSFNRLVNDVSISFQAEWPDYAYYSLMQLTDHCVTCHARIPATSQDEFSEKLLARMNLAELEPDARTLLYIATRRFDAALTSFEQRLLAPELEPVEADYRGLMLRYLKLAIATGTDPSRARTFIARYLERPDLPYFIARRLTHWVDALQELTADFTAAPTLTRGRALFAAATAATLAPGNRLRAVEDLVAARVLRGCVTAAPAPRAGERAEIYYMLAIIALRTTEPEPAVPELEMLLVAAIDADPTGPYAKDAYALLEEYGYVEDEHLARQLESHTLIDMDALKRRVLTSE